MGQQNPVPLLRDLGQALRWKGLLRSEGWGCAGWQGGERLQRQRQRGETALPPSPPPHPSHFCHSSSESCLFGSGVREVWTWGPCGTWRPEVHFRISAYMKEGKWTLHLKSYQLRDVSWCLKEKFCEPLSWNGDFKGCHISTCSERAPHFALIHAI